MLKNQKAFTLIELMVTISVLGVIIGLALPSFNRQIATNRSIALGENFLSTLNFVRYEAIKRATRVSICASSDSTTATPSCTGDWKDGYIVFVDNATSDQASSVDLGSGANKIIIKKFAKADTNANIKVTTNGAAVSFIRFTSLGTLGRVSSSAIAVETNVTGCKGDNGSLITLGLAGTTYVQKAACQ